MDPWIIVFVEAGIVGFALVALLVVFLRCRTDREELLTLLAEVRAVLSSLAAPARASPAPGAPPPPALARSMAPPPPSSPPTRSLPAESMVERRASPSMPPGLSRPYQPSAEEIAIARAAHEKAEIRQRLEAEEDARERDRWMRETRPEAARPAIRPPPPGVAEALGAPGDLPGMLGVSVTPTLPSAGAVPSEDPVEARYAVLCADARGKSLRVDHCFGDECWNGDGAVQVCACRCDGCVRALALCDQAEREIMGPPQIDTPRDEDE